MRKSFVDVIGDEGEWELVQSQSVKHWIWEVASGMYALLLR